MTMVEDKLEVVKREVSRVNIDILRISKLKWTGMGELNSGDHYICYCGQKWSIRNGVARIASPSIFNEVMGPDVMILVF